MSAAEIVETPRFREYETIYVMRSNVTAEAAAKVAKRVEDVVGREGGKLTLVESWGRRLLAYVVKGSSRGVYIYVKYVGYGKIVTEVERNLRMLDEVIKFQTVLVNEVVDIASLAVDPEIVKFEEVQPPDPDDVEPTLAQTLGLEIIERPRPVFTPPAEVAPQAVAEVETAEAVSAEPAEEREEEAQ